MKILPHPIPYQGSKRLLAADILREVRGVNFACLFEPFAGSAAISLSAAQSGIASSFRISDSLAPLAGVWECIINDPVGLADAYESIWNDQFRTDGHYNVIRAAFNSRASERNSVVAAQLLYLLARCVKNAPRFNQTGQFNQSADLRRHGMKPVKMRSQLMGAEILFRGKAAVSSCDYADAVSAATSDDLVYMDPPYQGTSLGVDRRYFQQLTRENLIAVLAELNRKSVPFLLSYDGRHGDKTYGEELPVDLEMQRREIYAGRSSQATLNGREVETYESLYVSKALRAKLGT